MRSFDYFIFFFFFFSSRRRHTRLQGDWSSDVCSSDLGGRLTHPAPEDQRDSQVHTRLDVRGIELERTDEVRDRFRGAPRLQERESEVAVESRVVGPQRQGAFEVVDCRPRVSPIAEHGAELVRSEEHTSELQSPCNLVCRLLLEKKKKKIIR